MRVPGQPGLHSETWKRHKKVPGGSAMRVRFDGLRRVCVGGKSRQVQREALGWWSLSSETAERSLGMMAGRRGTAPTHPPPIRDASLDCAAELEELFILINSCKRKEGSYL